MTREEAIARIELAATEMTGTLAATTEPSAAEVLQRYIDAYDMAISALREQEERSKGCEYCTEYKELPEHCPNDGQDVGRIFDTCIQETNQGWHIELPTNFDIGIRFCPMCGRRLEEV